MADDLIAKRDELARRIQQHERTAAQIKGIVKQRAIASHGTGGREGEELRDPVSRQQLHELSNRGHDTAHAMEFDPNVHIHVAEQPELHDMRRQLKHKDALIKKAKAEKATHTSWGEAVGQKPCKKVKRNCRKGSHVEHLHEEKHHLDGDIGHNQIH